MTFMFFRNMYGEKKKERIVDHTMVQCSFTVFFKHRKDISALLSIRYADRRPSAWQQTERDLVTLNTSTTHRPKERPKKRY